MFGKILIYLLRDTAIFKILWSFLVLFKINNITNKWTSPLFLFLLGYGFLIILYDLFTESKVFKNKYIFIILMFIILMGISVIANYENRFNDNIRLFISTSIQIIIITRIDLTKSKDNYIREMQLINNIIIIIITITSIVSFGMYIMGINGTYKVLIEGSNPIERLYHYGLTDYGRLTGVYSNPNRLSLFVSIAIIGAVINLILKKRTFFVKGLYVFSIIINYFCLVLSDSRASIVSLIAGFLVLVYMGSFYIYRDEKVNLRKHLKLVVITGIAIILLYQSIGLTGSVFTNIQLKRKQDIVNVIDKNDSISNGEIELNLGRLEELDSFDIKKASNGRIKIWEIGLNTIIQKPLFGVGQTNVYEAVSTNWNKGKVPLAIRGGGMHNIYIETLVAFGVPVFIVLMLFLILILFDLTKTLFNAVNKNKNDYFHILVVVIMVVFILLNNLFETRMLYTTNLSSFVFLLYVGYGMYLVQMCSYNKENDINL